MSKKSLILVKLESKLIPTFKDKKWDGSLTKKVKYILQILFNIQPYSLPCKVE